MRFEALRRLGFVLALSVGSVASGCDDEAPAAAQLDESEAAEIRRILTTGVEHPDDPYVRAETFRVLEMLADDRLRDMAQRGIDDADPMVRLASLRAMLASGHPKGRSTALDMFRKEKGRVQAAVLDAALAHGNPPLRREIVGRALRTGDARLRVMAFERGLLARIDAAKQAGDDENLERHLLPDLGTYVTMDDPVLAGIALAKFEQLGKPERAEPIVEKFASRRTSNEDRVKAGSILVRAHSSLARKEFDRVMKRWEESMNSDKLGLPEEVVPQNVLRIAMLGTIATGDATYVERAQKYTKNVDTDAMLEVLEALSANPSKDAEVSLRIAMQDARSDVRSYAIDAYKERDDVDPEALYAILPAAPFATQRQVAQILWSRFPDVWVSANREALMRDSERGAALRLLRNVITRADEIRHIAALEDTLKKVANTEKEEQADVARYLLALIARDSGDASDDTELLAGLDERTLYAYLELLVSTGAEDAQVYRKYFYADNFALRLMSAAGLWKVTGGSEPPAAVADAGE